MYFEQFHISFYFCLKLQDNLILPINAEKNMFSRDLMEIPFLEKVVSVYLIIICFFWKKPFFSERNKRLFIFTDSWGSVKTPRQFQLAITEDKNLWELKFGPEL